MYKNNNNESFMFGALDYVVLIKFEILKRNDQRT